MNPFNQLPTAAFRVRISGAALREAILARIHRETEAHGQDDKRQSKGFPGAEGAILAEKDQNNEVLIGLKLVAEHLIDDKLYLMTCRDVISMTTATIPFVPKIFASLMPLIELLRPDADV